MNNIEIITPEDMGYFVVKYNDEIYYTGNEIPDFVWMELIKKQGVEIIETDLSDEEFEELYC